MNNRLNMMSRRRSRVAREFKLAMGSDWEGVSLVDSTGRKHVSADSLPNGQYDIFVCLQKETLGKNSITLGVFGKRQTQVIVEKALEYLDPKSILVIPSRMRDYFNKVGGGSS